jgi:hypothetical protein
MLKQNFLAISLGIQEAVWINKLEKELNCTGLEKGQCEPITIFNINTACITNFNENDYCLPNQHIGVHYWWIRDMIWNKEEKAQYTTIEKMKAHGFTKALERIKHQAFLHDLRLTTQD